MLAGDKNKGRSRTCSESLSFEKQAMASLCEHMRLEHAQEEVRLREDIERERIAMERELKAEVRAELHQQKEELSLSVSKRIELEAEEESKIA